MSFVFPRIALRLAPAVFAALLLAACDDVEQRTQGHIERAVELAEAGEPEKAILEYRNALKLNRDSAAAHFGLAEIHEARGELQAAFGRYRRVTEIEPENFAARMKVAQFYILAREAEEARKQAEAARAIAPGEGDPYIIDASAALLEEDFAAARAALDEAAARPHDPVEFAIAEANLLTQTGAHAAALAVIDPALERSPEALPLYMVKLSILGRMNDAEGMGRHLSAMIERFPEEDAFLQYRIEWAVKTGAFDVAEADLRTMAYKDLTQPDPIINLIRLIGREKGAEAAREELGAIVEASEGRAENRLLLARLELETGARDAGVEILEALIGAGGPPANEARVELARVLLREGARERGVALIDEALADDPLHVEALLVRTEILIEDQRLDDAVITVRNALNQAPEDRRVLLLAARTQELAGNVDLANDRFAKAVRADGYAPDTVQVYVEFLLRQQRFTAAEAVLTEAARRNPREGRILDLLGFTRVSTGDFRGAEIAAAALEPLDAERARQLRAAILIGQERFDEGVAMLRDLPSDERRRAASITAVVQTYVRDGELDEAATFLEELLAEDPGNTQALGLRGNLHLAKGELDAAEEKYRAVLALDPANGGAHSALVRLYSAKGDEETANALLMAGIEASPDNALLRLRLAQLRETQGEYESAIAIYEDLYRDVPDSLVIVNNLASLLADHRTEDPAAVDRAYRLAGRLRDMDQIQYRDTYGWTRHLKGEHEAALERLLPVVEALPDNPWVNYHVGMVYAALEQPEKAIEHLEKAQALAADTAFPPREAIAAKLVELGKS